MPDANNNSETDWKAVAMALAQRVRFAINYCDCKGGGLMDFETQKVTPWRDYMAEALEMVPGVAVDREILATLSLPQAKRKKVQAEILAKRASVKGGA
jgi:hypothetical protein